MRFARPCWIGFVTALLLPATGALAQSTAVAVEPALPNEDQPVTLWVGGAGSCPTVEEIAFAAGFQPEVDVVLSDGCLSPVMPFLLEVPIGILFARYNRPWLVRVHLHDEITVLPVHVRPAPFEISLRPSHPRQGEEVTVVIRGTATSCGLSFEPVQVSGRLLSMPHTNACPILAPGPEVVEVPVTLGILSAGPWAAQVTGFEGETLASLRFAVGHAGDCVPTGNTLCLHDRRFAVQARWRTASAEGMAGTLPQTDESGAFWFFRRDNLELTVKVLDACRTSSPAFWVFAGGLTNVDVELLVTDTWSGQTWQHHNPGGPPFAPVFDHAALPTCNAAPGS